MRTTPSGARAKGKLGIVFYGERLRRVFTLVRTQAPQWLLINRHDEGSESAPDLVAQFSTSIETGRSMEELAADAEHYYEGVAPVLIPHLRHRAITHSSGSLIGFPMVQDLASLLWVVNLGCIDLNPLYAWCGAATPDEVAAFVKERSGMTRGGTGSFDKLEERIAL